MDNSSILTDPERNYNGQPKPDNGDGFAGPPDDGQMYNEFNESPENLARKERHEREQLENFQKRATPAGPMPATPSPSPPSPSPPSPSGDDWDDGATFHEVDLTDTALPPQPDQFEIIKALKLFIEPGAITEMRAIDATPNGYGRPYVISGYYSDWQKLADAAVNIHAVGIYFVLNPCNPALLARADNRDVHYSTNATCDGDILYRMWLFVDFDPVRPAHISSTDAEHNAALARARKVRDDMRNIGWPDPVFGDSGNGAHLIYPIDLPTNDGGLCEKILKDLAAKYSDLVVAVDIKTHNPSRLCKLYGTVACKGDHTADRPHRQSRILEVPAVIERVPIEKLEAFVATDTSPMVTAKTGTTAQVEIPGGRSTAATTPFNVQAWITAHKVPVGEGKEWRDNEGGIGKKWIFDTCPWNGAHTNRSAFIGQRANGAIIAGCQHNGCKLYGWSDLRRMYEPEHATTARPRGKGDSNVGKGQDQGSGVRSEPVFVIMSNVVAKPIEWIWKRIIARGKLSMFCGNPGVSKSLLSIDITARVTRGRAWPGDSSRTKVGSVIMLTAEDDLEDTVKPRLQLADADCTKVKILQAVRRTDENGEVKEKLFSLEEDLPALEKLLIATPDCAAVIIDPISAYMGNADSHNNSEVRGLLAPLVALAVKYHVAVIAIHHFNKNATAAAYKTMGSIAFNATARAVWAVVMDKDDPTKSRRLFLPIKNNNAADTGGLAFHIDVVDEVGQIVWSSVPVTSTVDEALADTPGTPGPPPAARKEAERWLTELLGNTAVLANDVKAQAIACMISAPTLRRAKEAVGVESIRFSNPGPWHWKLPKKAPDAQGPPPTCAPGP